MYDKANLFDQAGMASLFPPTPPPDLPKLDKRSLPPPIRQAIVDAHAEYPALSLLEIASICYVQFGRTPSPHPIQYILATGPNPSRTERRYQRFAEIDNPVERRRMILKLQSKGWTVKNIAGYLETSRQTVHTTLKRWAQEQFAGIEDKSHARTGGRKVDLKAVQEVKKLSENPLIGAYRVSAALEQMGIKLSRATCSRLLSLNRGLYHLQMPRKPKPKAEMPFRAERRHLGVQRRMAHEERQDGCHSPARVLGWVMGMQPEPELISRAFSAVGETRVLNDAGYAKVRNFLLYGQGLSGRETLITIFQDSLTLEFGEYPLSKYAVEWQPDDRHLLRVGNPRLYQHPYQSPQLPLREPGEVEWHVIIRCESQAPRRKRVVRPFVLQLPLLVKGIEHDEFPHSASVLAHYWLERGHASRDGHEPFAIDTDARRYWGEHSSSAQSLDCSSWLPCL